jgi:hypothetical protein
MKFGNHYCRNLSKSYFPIGEAYDLGRELFNQIDNRIDGWFVTSPYDAGVLSQMVKNAGDGDYLEIGTAWGGSAILAALVKQHYGLKGQIVCVDPIDGMDVMTKKQRSLDSILNNLRMFNVEAEIIVAPFSLACVKGRSFVAVLVDGDHSYRTVSQNWVDLQSIASHYVLFHDYDRAHPDIIRATNENREGWQMVHLSGGSMILERV